MLENIALTPEDRMAVGMHLCKPEFQVHCSFLISMGEDYISCWVLNHLSGDYPADGRTDDPIDDHTDDPTHGRTDDPANL